MLTNLHKIGEFPDLAPNVYPTAGIQSAVATAILQECDPATFDKSVNGFRRSTATAEALIADYKRGDIPHHKVLKDEHYFRALKRTKELFQPSQKYRPVSFPDLRYYPWPLSSSAEAPFTASDTLKTDIRDRLEKGELDNDRVSFHNLYNHIFVFNRECVHRIKDGETTDIFGRDLRYWNTAHARAHLVSSDDEDKIRMVFGVPKLLLMVECMFLWPLILFLLTMTAGPMLWGFETLKGGWAKLYAAASQHPYPLRTWLAFDWKQFDKRALHEVIDDIHNIIESYIDFENGYIPTQDYPHSWTNPERLKQLWRWMCDAIKSTPDILPSGEMFRRLFAGIASGFFETQLLDSMYNMIMLLTILSRMGINIDKIFIKVQGDDSIIGLLEYIPDIVHSSFKDLFAKYALTYFGAILNEKKSKISNDLNGLPVLGFTNTNGFPTRTKEELLASLLYPERQTDPARLMARCVGIAWANCGNHSDVYRVCENVYNYFAKQGYSPNYAGLPDVIKSQFLVYGKGDFSDYQRFPTFFETIRELGVYTQNEKSWSKIWPTDIFLSTY